MADEATRYSKDLQTLPSGHPYEAIRVRLSPGDRVLDVGCGSGEIGAYLTAGGMVVDGIEADDERATVASGRLRKVVHGLGGPGFDADALDTPYDAVVLIDVVEHVVDPVGFLRWCATLLRDDGRVLCLVPNSAHWRFRRKILRGDWSYEDTGLFDRDHVRFFDTNTIGAVGAAAGLREAGRTYFPAPGRQRRVKDVLAERWPNLGAFYALLDWRTGPNAAG